MSGGEGEKGRGTAVHACAEVRFGCIGLEASWSGGGGGGFDNPNVHANKDEEA